MEIVSFLIAVISSIISYFIVDHTVLIFRKPKNKVNYNERLKRLTANLSVASKEVESILIELANVAETRELSVKKLESELNELETRESTLKSKIELLQKTPLPVADHFASLLESGERKSRKRDYLLFAGGVLVSAIISVILSHYKV